MLKVGDTIHKFDINHRVYARDANGRATSGAIYAEFFVPFVIKGETKQSWLTGYRGETRVNKKTLKESGKNGFGGHQWFTDDGKAAQLWLHDHRQHIIRALENGTVDQLKRVAEIVGYAA